MDTAGKSCCARFFLDTASLADIESAIAWGVFSGVTSNPVLVAQESTRYREHVDRILAALPKQWELSLQVRTGSADEMARQARALASWDDRIRVKLAATPSGLQAAACVAPDVPVNMTIVKSSAQGMLCLALATAVQARDMVISVFCDRLRQAGHDWQGVLRALAQCKGRTRLVAASMKTPSDIADAIMQGVDIVTAPFSVYGMAMSSPLVDEDVQLFNAAFDRDGLLPPV